MAVLISAIGWRQFEINASCQGDMMKYLNGVLQV